MSNVVNIRRIINLQTLIESTPPERRDFRNVLLVTKSAEINSQRVNYYTSYADVVTAHGSNSEAAKGALKFFSGGFRGIRPSAFWVANFDEDGGEVWADVIVLLLADPRFYFLALDNTFSEAENKALAAAIEASTKINYMGAYLSFDGIAASTALASDSTSMIKSFYTFDYARCFSHYDNLSASAEYKQLADLSYFATVGYTQDNPLGSLAFKQFSGQTPTDFGANVDQYTTNLEDKHCNYYTAFGEVGRNNVYKGVLANGAQINVQVGADWMEYNITYEIYDLLVDLPNLAYTNEDFNKLYSAIDTVCQQAVAAKIIAPGTDTLTGENYPNGYKITIPDPKTVDATEKAQGKLTGVSIVCIIAGSVVEIELTNLLKY
jgi:hypothetical protein